MARDLYIDLDSRKFVDSANNATLSIPHPFFKGDTETLNLYFLQRTGIVGTPYAFADKSSSSAKVSFGTPGQTALLSVTGFTAIPTSVTASVTKIQTGSFRQNDIQKLSFSKVPQSGYFRLSVPEFQVFSSWEIGNSSSQWLPDKKIVITQTPSIADGHFTRAIFNGVTGAFTSELAAGRSYYLRHTWVYEVNPRNNYLDIWDFSNRYYAYSKLATIIPEAPLQYSTNGLQKIYPNGDLQHLGNLNANKFQFSSEISNYVVGITAGVDYWKIPAIQSGTNLFRISSTDPNNVTTPVTGYSVIQPISSSFTITQQDSRNIDTPITERKIYEALSDLTTIGVFNCKVTKASETDFLIEFIGANEFKEFPLLTVTNNTAAAPGLTTTVGITSAAITTLLSGTTSASTTLEVELTSGGNKLTAAQGDAVIALDVSH